MVVDFVSSSDIILFAVAKKKDRELQGKADAKAATKNAVMKHHKAGKDNKSPSKKGAGSKRGGSAAAAPKKTRMSIPCKGVSSPGMPVPSKSPVKANVHPGSKALDDNSSVSGNKYLVFMEEEDLVSRLIICVITLQH